MFEVHGKAVLAVLLCSLLFAHSPVTRAAEPVVQPAVDGILAAFDTHPLVGLGEIHNLANELNFYTLVVRDPRFAAKVGNVVVEFGGSQHQDTLDRYLDGKSVTYMELSKVWRNTLSHDPTLEGVGYQTFFAVVREVNSTLPPDQRIRVWLSEPPIEWSRIQTKEAWQRIYDQRETHAAVLIGRDILGRGKKALVIYGTGHFFSLPWPSTWPKPSAGTESLGDILERSHPGALYRILPYSGYKVAGCSAALEAQMKWPRRVLIAPVRGTALQETLMRPECMSPPQQLDPAVPADELARLSRRFYEIDSGAAGDALLYMAPAADLKLTPSDPAIWMDSDYDKELRRRYRIRHGEALEPLIEGLRFFAQPPQPWNPR
jgi:hypothetical protein